MPGHVAPDRISPGLRSTPTAGPPPMCPRGHPAQARRSAPRSRTAARCLHVGSRWDHGRFAPATGPLPGVPRAPCVQPALAEPGLAAAANDTHAAGAVSAPGAIGGCGKGMAGAIHAPAQATIATVCGAARASASSRCAHGIGLRRTTPPAPREHRAHRLDAYLCCMESAAESRPAIMSTGWIQALNSSLSNASNSSALTGLLVMRR